MAAQEIVNVIKIDEEPIKIKGEVQEDDTAIVEKVGFPMEELERGFLRYRMMWMLQDCQWFRYTSEGSKILLEGWSVSRTLHYLVRTYGELKTFDIKWAEFKIPLNIIEVYEQVDTINLPMTVESGHGPAFIVSERTMRSFWRMIENPEEDGDQGARVRLLFHCLVDRRIFPELSLQEFASWGGDEILTLLSTWDGLAPGHIWSRSTATEVGLMGGLDASIIEITEKETGEFGGQGPCVSLNNIEAEPVKGKGIPGSERKSEKEGSPELAEVVLEPRRNDVDEAGPRSRNNAKRRRRRRRGMRRVTRGLGGQGQGLGVAPQQLARAQELEVMRLLVLGVCPGASEEYIKQNQVEYYSNKMKKEKEVPVYPKFAVRRESEEFGNGPGLWTFSQEEKKEMMEELAEVKEACGEVEQEETQDGSFASFVSMLSRSSVTSPRGEISMMGQDAETPGTSSSAGSSAPAKRPRVSLSVASSLSDLPALVSPLMAKGEEGKAVVTITSSESSEEGIWDRVKKMTLYELSRSNFLVYCDDGCLGVDKEKKEPEQSLTQKEEGEELKDDEVFEEVDINSNGGDGGHLEDVGGEEEGERDEDNE